MIDHLSIGDRWRIVSLRLDQGMPPHRIASVIGCSRATVFNILRLFHDTNNVIEREGRGRTLLNNKNRISEEIIADTMAKDLMCYRLYSFFSNESLH